MLLRILYRELRLLLIRNSCLEGSFEQILKLKHMIKYKC